MYYLTFYRAKINYFFDQTSINETKTNISDQNYAIIFGEKNEIVFHKQMSIEAQVKTLSKMLDNYREFTTDPF